MTYLAPAQPFGRDKRTRSLTRALARETALSYFSQTSVAAVTKFATVVVMLELARCCCAPLLTRHLVRYGCRVALVVLNASVAHLAATQRVPSELR